jgi:hypothetical protein
MDGEHTQHDLNGTHERSNIYPGIRKQEANGTPT